MSNDFYNHNDGVPATLTRGASTTIRSEFDLVQAAFDKLPSLAQFFGNTGTYVVAGGSADNWTATVAIAALTAYVDGMQVRVKFPNANTTSTPVINLNGLGTQRIVSEQGGALNPGDIAAGEVVTLTYNTTFGKFQMTLGNSVASAQAAASTATAQAVIAGADAAAAHADRLLADADATATAADRVATANYAAASASAAKFYDTIALGRAGVADTFTFGVKAGGSDALARPTVYRRDSSSTQTLLYAVVSGTEHDAHVKALGSEVTDQLGPVNLFNLANRTTGSVIHDGGTVSALGGYYITDYLPVVAGGTITFNQTLTGASAPYGVHFFDSAKVYLATGAQPTASTPITVPAGAFYARSNMNNGAHDTLMVVQGSVLPAVYLPFGLPNPLTTKKQSQLVTQGYLRGRENLYDPTKITTGKFVQDGAEVASGIGFITNYMPVTPGGFLTMAFADPAFTTSYELAFYDEDKNYLTGTGVYGPFSDGQVVAVPTRAFFARRSYTYAYQTKAVFLDGNVASPGPWQQYYKPYASDFSKWAGKNVVMFGDSLSNNYGTLWPPIVCSRLFANFFLDLTDGGQRYDTALNAHTNGTAGSTNIAASHLCFIGYGTNDFRNGTPIGGISDSAATASFYGYTRKLFEQLLTWNPALRIGVWTPPKMTGWQTPVGSGGPLNAYADAIQAQARVYGIPVLDMFNESQMSDYSITTLTGGDGIHPLQTHQVRLFGNPVEGFLRRI